MLWHCIRVTLRNQKVSACPFRVYGRKRKREREIKSEGVGILRMHIAVTQRCPQLEDHPYLIILYAVDPMVSFGLSVDTVMQDSSMTDRTIELEHDVR